MRFKNLFQSFTICMALFSVFANAQAPTVAKAHVIYDGNNIYYADNESDLRYQSLKAEEDGTFTINFTEERLANGKKDARKLRLGLGCNDGVCRKNLLEGHEPYLGELFPDYKDGVQDQPVYEVWIVVNEDSTFTKYDSKPTLQPVKKVCVRFLAPWNNTNAIVFVNGDENLMSPVGSPYCGWFESKIVPPKSGKDFYVYFKQTIGGTFVGSEGMSKEEIPAENEILLDSVLALSDTVWVKANGYGSTEVFSDYPGVLGDCPVKKLPVMMFDWYDGSVNSDGTKDGFEWPRNKPAGRNGFDKRGVPMYGEGTSRDFGQKGCEADPMTGMVEKELGANGVPVRASNFPSNCTNAANLNRWFLPEVIGKDAAGVEYTNATCRDIELSLTDDGFWYAQVDDSSPEGGLFLLDDFRYLDSAKTVENIYYDSLPGLEVNKVRGYHNFGFTMKIQATFQYVKGQYFEFNGDDDVWVFIDNKLVVDIGGQHQKVKRSINLDKLGLKEDSTYNFHIFYAERKREASNFMMRTSIDLKVNSSMTLANLSDDSTLIKKEVWQIIKEKTLACDFSASPDQQRSERGPSTFTLFGKSLPTKGVLITADSVFYHGITVENNYTLLTINTKSITKAQALPPGTYMVRVALRSNPDEYKDVYFTIDPYELPNLAFASIKDSSYCILVDIETSDSLCFDEYWHPFGSDSSRNVSSDSIPINLNKKEVLWAGRTYPVNVMYAEEWASIYNGVVVNVSSSDPKLIPCDSMGTPITETMLFNGKRTIYVKGTGEVRNATLTISSAAAKNQSVSWLNINMQEPPVPQVEEAFIFDRDGDGRTDSIWISFNKPLGGQSILDSLTFMFGSSPNGFYKVKYKDGDTHISLVANGTGFGPVIYTGGSNSVHHGMVNLWYTYTNEKDNTKSVFEVEGVLTDKAGPVITAAEITYTSDGKTQLTLMFSEGLDVNNATVDFFRFHSWANGVLDSNIIDANYIVADPASKWVMIFPQGDKLDVVPIVGDSVRIRPPSQNGKAVDLFGNSAHENNPWVRITGSQRVTITCPSVIDMEPGTESFERSIDIVRSDSATVPILVESEQNLTAEQVGNIYGTQGHYLGDLDMGKLVENEIAEIVKIIQSNPTYDEKVPAVEGAPLGTYTTLEILNMLDNGQISIDDVQERFGMSDVIVSAYRNGLLTTQNYDRYAHGTDSDIQKIVGSVAESTELHYQTSYFTSLGHYVNSSSGTIKCSDEIFKTGGHDNCIGTNGRLFFAWNMTSNKKRLVATGAYIARLDIRIRVNGKTIADRLQDFMLGFRRGDVTIGDFGL